MVENDRPTFRFYGRRHGKRLSPRQLALLDEVLPRLAPVVDGDRLVELPPHRVLWLEIGFGGGEHLLAQAAAHPEKLLVGCEPFVEGVAKALSGIVDRGLDNVLIHAEDARPLLELLPRAAVERVFVLFPDPWPKRRHHKRRFVSRDNLDRLARVMAPGAILRVATDHMDYARWILAETLAHPAFEWTAETADDWRRPPPDHVTTRYEAKLLAGSRPLFFEFRRRGHDADLSQNG